MKQIFLTIIFCAVSNVFLLLLFKVYINYNFLLGIECLSIQRFNGQYVFIDGKRISFYKLHF